MNAPVVPRHVPACRPRGSSSSGGRKRSGAELLVVRHARAGDRQAWCGDDRLRPLDKKGYAQALALVDALESFEIERILSSPYVRCAQTVEPLAARRHVVLELRGELSEGRREGVGLARSLAGEPVVICVHGGLSDVAFGERLKKAEVLAVDSAGVAVRRFRV